MPKTRIRTFTFLCLSVLAFFVVQCGGDQDATDTEVLLADACHYLWQQQAQDGGWHSATHGLLRGGQAWTPLVLFALLEAPDTTCPSTPDRVEKALAFVRNHTSAEGVLGLADPDILEYPNYATAYALRVFIRHGEQDDQPLMTRMQAYLLQQQFVSHRGISPEHLAFGAWGFGETNVPLGKTGHIDLSHTRRVLEALAEAGHTDTTTYANTTHFLRLIQKHPSEARLQPSVEEPETPSPTFYDGGFYASPVVLSTNKGGLEQAHEGYQPYFRSYATATCDGVLALLASGAAIESEPVQAALQWLYAHPGLAQPQGIPEDNPIPWHKVMFFYHLAVRAEVYAATEGPEGWQDALTILLKMHIQPDGHFQNPHGAPNKEDDPLLATALAVIALNHAL